MERGWTKRGLPTMEKLKKFQIEDLAGGLEETIEGGDT